MRFSAPYFDANQGVLIRKGIAEADEHRRAEEAPDLRPGRHDRPRVSPPAPLRPSKKPLVYNASSSAAFDAVEAGSATRSILDVPIVVSQSQKKKGAYGGVIGQIVTHEGYGAVIDKGSKLKPFVNKAIKALQRERDDRQAAEEVASRSPGCRS